MSRKDFIQQLRITSPCSVEWDAMIGNDRVRFCEHCQLSVHHVDALTRKQFRRLIARSNGRICVNYTRSQQVQNTLPILHKIGRRTSALAAGAFSATLGLSAATATAQPNLRRPAIEAPVVVAAILNNRSATNGNATLRGRVSDANGAVIAKATVVLTNCGTNEARNTTTNEDGDYVFDNLEAGTYTMTIESPGFTRQTLTDINVQAGAERRMDQTLQVGLSSTGGVVVMIMAKEPLVLAAMMDDLDAVNAALAAKPDANVRDKETHATALEYAVQNGNREILQVLLGAKADVNAKGDEGQTALMMLSDKVTVEIVWDLINAGAKVNAHDKDGDTALITAAEVNNVEALKALIDAGAKVNAANESGETALMKAASAGFVNNVHALVMAGANVNARDKDGKTALMYAQENSDSPVIRLLKAHGAIEFVLEQKQ
jgi:hypothetical protein